MRSTHWFKEICTKTVRLIIVQIQVTTLKKFFFLLPQIKLTIAFNGSSPGVGEGSGSRGRIQLLTRRTVGVILHGA